MCKYLSLRRCIYRQGETGNLSVKINLSLSCSQRGRDPILRRESAGGQAYESASLAQHQNNELAFFF